MSKKLQFPLSVEARAVLLERNGRTNRARRLLRDWLIRSYEAAVPTRMAQVPLFAETIEVEDDVPLLLEALTRVTGRTANELVDAWAIEEPSPGEFESEKSAVGDSTTATDSLRDRISELIDLAETLFEETISDVEHRFGGYPAGKQAEASARDIYRALRLLLGIVGTK